MLFYKKVVKNLIESGAMSVDDSILVACGGPYDATVLRESNCRRVVISNLDDVMNRELTPFDWARQDAEQLSYPDGSFDWAIVNAGLHHCSSPHRGLLELCRVSRKGVLVLEARDSALIRLAVTLGFTVDFETEAVALSDFKWGGVRNTAVPNFIYRWTEREVWKTVESAYPHRINDIKFFYGLRLPTQRLAMSGAVRRMVARSAGVLATVIQKIAPKQCNEFGFAIMNTGTLKPWIIKDGQSFAMNSKYESNYDPSKYERPNRQAPSGGPS
jgi:SAM-dependent methyltransferase